MFKSGSLVYVFVYFVHVHVGTKHPSYACGSHGNKCPGF